MQTLPLDCLTLFNRPLVFRTEADICIYLPCYQLLSQAHTHTSYCPTQVVLPYLSLFRPSLATHFSLLHPSHYPHLRRVFFLLCPPDSTCIPLFNEFFQEFFSPFTHSLHSLHQAIGGLIFVLPSSVILSSFMWPPMYRWLNSSIFHFRPRMYRKLLNKTSAQAIYLSRICLATISFW